MLTQQDIYDQEGLLDVESLFLEAHLELADTENALDWYVQDPEEENGTKELVVLRADYSVELFQMTDSGNEAENLDRAQMADCLLVFGGRLLENDPEAALACDLIALEERTDADAREACVSAYQQCSLKHEAEDDYDSALADASAGFDISPSADTFTFYVGVMQRRCAAEENQETGIKIWREFIEEEAASFAYYGMEGDAQEYTGKLCLDYALSLSSWCDESAIAWFKDAKAEGLDIKDGLVEALEYFTPCRTSVELRMMLLEELEDGSEEYEEQKELISDELLELLDGNGSAAALTDANDRLVLLLWAVELDALAEDTDVMVLYYNALEDAAGAVTMLSFLYQDWDGDGWPDLVGLDSQGKVVDYSVSSEGVVCNTQEESGFSDLQILSFDKDYIMAADAEGTAFAIYVVEDGVPVKQFTVDNISSLTQEGSTLTYKVALDGSVERYQCLSYEIGGQPVEQGIIWPEDDYPFPDTALAAVEQAMEAYALGLDDEYALLVAEGEIDEWMSFEKLGSIPVPVFPVSLAADGYWYEDGCELVRAVYETDNGIATRYFTVNQDENGIWRLSGVSESPLGEGGSSDTAESDDEAGNESSVETAGLMLCLNQESQDTLTETGESRSYEIILPYDARVYMSWQSGEENGSKTAYQVTLCQEGDQDNPIFSYNLKASASTQQSQTILLEAGYYQLTVTAGEQDFGEYTIELLAEAGVVIEKEPNGEVTSANKIEVNSAVHANLGEETDMDYYRFVLDGQAAVSFLIESDAGQLFKVTLYAQLPDSENTYQTTLVNSLDGEEPSETVSLAAGNYVLKVESDGEWSSSEYVLTVLAEETENGEAEPNNTMGTATPLETGCEIQAAAGTNGDIDYFSFRLDASSLVDVSFEFPATTSEKDTYEISLIYGTETILWSVTVAGTEGAAQSEKLVLMEGAYAVKVENLKWNSTDNNSYTLLVSAEPVAAEIEPNDSFAANATELELNTSVYGSILLLTDAQSQDIDNYTFTLDTAGCVTIQLDYEGQESASAVYQVTLADASAAAIWSCSASGNADSASSGQIWLDAGTYLIQIREGRQTTPAAYQMSVAYEPDEYSECEINDTDTAALTVGQPIHGSIATENDVDCFAFTLEEEETLHLTCSTEGAEAGSLYISILQDGEELWNKEFNMSDGEFSQALQIPAGSYVLMVSSGEEWSNTAYVLSLE